MAKAKILQWIDTTEFSKCPNATNVVQFTHLDYYRSRWGYEEIKDGLISQQGSDGYNTGANYWNYRADINRYTRTGSTPLVADVTRKAWIYSDVGTAHDGWLEKRLFLQPSTVYSEVVSSPIDMKYSLSTGGNPLIICNVFSQATIAPFNTTMDIDVRIENTTYSFSTPYPAFTFAIGFRVDWNILVGGAGTIKVDMINVDDNYSLDSQIGSAAISTTVQDLTGSECQETYSYPYQNGVGRDYISNYLIGDKYLDNFGLVNSVESIPSVYIYKGDQTRSVVATSQDTTTDYIETVSFDLPLEYDGGKFEIDYDYDNVVANTYEIAIEKDPVFTKGTLSASSVSGFDGDGRSVTANNYETCSGDQLYYRWTYYLGTTLVIVGYDQTLNFNLTKQMDEQYIQCEIYDNDSYVNEIGGDDRNTFLVSILDCYKYKGQTTAITGYKDNIKPVFVAVDDCDFSMTYSWRLVSDPTVLSTSASFNLTLTDAMDGQLLRCDMNNNITMIDIPITVDGCFSKIDQTDAIEGNKSDTGNAFVMIDQLCPDADDIILYWYISNAPQTEIGDGTDNISFELTTEMNNRFLQCDSTPDIGITPIPLTVNNCPLLTGQQVNIIGDWGSQASASVTAIECVDNPISYKWFIDSVPTVILGTESTVDFTLNSFMNGRNLICISTPELPIAPIPITVNNLPTKPNTWWIRKADGDYYDVKCRDYDQDIIINFKLQELANRKYNSIDRGERSDRYATKLSFSGTQSYINGLIDVITDLRIAKQPVIMGSIPEGIFGDHINYEGEISTLVSKFGELGSNKFNTLSWDVELLATNLIFTTDSDIPDSMDCLSHNYNTSTEWNTSINETYYRNNYFVDRSVDKYTFEGNYILSNTDTAELYNFWRTQRGEVFQATEEQFGVTNMFGSTFDGSTAHDVIIINISYTRLSPTLRTVTLKMVKV